MSSKPYILLLALMLLAIPVRAQFYVGGSEPASVRWSTIETQSYKIIYPRGLDSLAMVYARNLENVKIPASGSIGYVPNQSYRNKMPVVLHAYQSIANGEVVWAPRRMELITIPDAYDPESAPWDEHLTIHESRHVAQMQPGAAAPFRFWNLLTGQIADGAFAAIYGGPSFFEGDAVAAETALTGTGRGRMASFMEYFRTSFAAGDYRDYWKWRWGSQRYNTPDYYRIGYLLSSGMCSVYGAQDFTASFYNRIKKHNGIAFFNLENTVKDISGKNFNDAFSEIAHEKQKEWAADDSLRAPFMPSQQVTPTQKRFTEYNGIEFFGKTLVAIRKSLTSPGEFVKIDSTGKAHTISLFASYYTEPRYSEVMERLYWSEHSQDARWGNLSYSDIRYVGYNLVPHTLTHGKRYFYPSPSASDSLLAVSEYPAKGGSAVVVIDAQTGKPVKSFAAPDGMQVVETVWMGNKIFASAITDGGFGIYDTENYSCVLAPQHVIISGLLEYNGRIVFSSDRTGVNEYYSFDPDNGRVTQLTNTKSGASDFTINADDGNLYYTVLAPDGQMIYKTALSDLKERNVDFSDVHADPAAEKLSAAEKMQPDYDKDVEVSEVRNYSRLANLFRIHSWLPFYLNYDEVSRLSFEDIASEAGIGATAFFQNDLGNAYGFLGYNYLYSAGSWRHTGHAKFVYTGLYPVIEASFDYNDSDRYHYKLNYDQTTHYSYRLTYEKLGQPEWSGNLSTYIPLYWQSGGISFGVVPKVSLDFTNTYLTRSFVIPGTEINEDLNMSRIVMNIRGYAMQRTPSSRIYPRLGIGAEAGLSSRIQASKVMGKNIYAFIYGYLPGFHPAHGLRLSATYEKNVGNIIIYDSYARTVPRGFSSASAMAFTSYPDKAKLSADYAMPVLPVDWSFLSPAAYIRNFELILHGDLSLYANNTITNNLYSVGADFDVRLGNLLWIPYDTRIGVSYNYNGGFLYQQAAEADKSLSRNTFSLLFSVNF